MPIYDIFIRAIGEMIIIFRTYSRARREERSRHWLLELVTAPFVHYAIAGPVGTLLYYVALTASVELFALPPTTGALIGAPLGALINCVLNYHLVFATARPHRTTLPRFAIVAAFGCC